jgi:hypothetical protein
MKFLSVFTAVTFVSVAFSQRIPFPLNPGQVFKFCPTCNFSPMWPYKSSTGVTGNCFCFGARPYRVFLDGTPQKTCCSRTCPRCPNYSVTPCTCAPPLHLLYPWNVNNGYCCDIIVGLGERQQESEINQKRKKCHPVQDKNQ